ncbi:hypothetical protein FHX49_001091 [Microbacterium endophyticum]|uniref:Uncharacterized protein n=1 Tax=Microbacterium endophyticum TaxID=1526412 RepID=A0A7W4V2B9_9MICO|nr:hypothetical protein [Microbacterium endophyticum]MBB2975525.1 hypothetical protein [Microbacterium endophyticum]NIK35456.1 hypothetical protein [Microbacterium endophyticum]
MTEETTEPSARSGAYTLPTWVRWLLGLLGIISAFGAVLVLTKEHPSDLAASTILVITGVAWLLALVGRLPKSFEVAGMTLEYEQDEMADFISTLRGSGIEQDTEDALLKQLSAMSRDKRTFRKAKNQSNKTSSDDSTRMSEPDGDEYVDDSGQAQSGAESTGIPKWISELADGNQVGRSEPVRGAGRGNPPIVDFKLTVGGVGVVVQTPRAWSPTSLGLLRARIERVLAEGTDVSFAVVVSPPEALEKIEREFRSVSDELSQRIKIYAADKVEPKAVRQAVERLGRA